MVYRFGGALFLCGFCVIFLIVFHLHVAAFVVPGSSGARAGCGSGLVLHVKRGVLGIMLWARRGCLSFIVVGVRGCGVWSPFCGERR